MALIQGTHGCTTLLGLSPKGNASTNPAKTIRKALKSQFHYTIRTGKWRKNRVKSDVVGAFFGRLI